MTASLLPLEPIDFTPLDACVAKHQATSKRLEAQLQEMVASIDTGLHILLIGGKDLLAVQKYLQEELQAEVQFTQTGEEALASFHEQPADLVVIDSQLKGVNIEQLLDSLRADVDPAESFASVVVTSDEAFASRPPRGVDSAVMRPLGVSDFVRVVKNLYKLKDTGAYTALVSAHG